MKEQPKKTFVDIDDLEALLNAHDEIGGGFITTEAAAKYHDSIEAARKSK